MTTPISSAAKSAALAQVRGIDEEDRPAIFYVDRHVVREWQGYAGYVEVVSHTLRNDDDALAMQILAYTQEPYVMIDAATGYIDAVNPQGEHDDNS
tara:strand:- start:5398 stop:5685 length:288 start_codon:yes stop_codon:yes gene_type:complete